MGKFFVGRSVGTLILLVVLGSILDCFPLVVFLGHRAYLGSFFGFFAIFLLGNLPGALAMAAIASMALFRGDLCYFAVGAMEALFIALSYRGRRLNMPLLDAIYWFALGLWAAFLGSMRTGQPFAEALLSAAIFSICGITAAAGASLSFDYLRASIPHALSALKLGGDSEVPFRRVVFEYGLLLCLAPLFAFLVISSQSRIQGLSSEVEQRLRTIASSYRFVSEVWLDEKSSELASIAHAASRSRPSERASELEALAATEPGIRAVGILDASGRVVATSASSSSGAIGGLGSDLSSTAAYSSAVGSGEEAVSAMLGPDGRPLLLLVQPLAGQAQRMAAYSELAADPLSRLLSGIAPDGRVVARIVDASDRIVASSVEADAPFAPYVRGAGYVPLGELRGDLDRPGVYLEADAALGSGWKVAFALPMAPLRATVVATGLVISFFTLGAVFAILVLSIFASKLLVSSLEALRQSADRFNERAAGDVALAWPESRISEVASLSRSFSEASELLYRRYKETMASLGEAADASYEKEKLLAAVSHDIRGPLGGIVDMAKSLESSLCEGDKREQARLIEETGRELLVLVEDLLDRAALQAGRFELREETFDLRLLFDSVARAYRPVAEAKGLAFRLEWDEGLARRVVGDRSRLFQVIGNLVDNAVKYTESGEVALSAAVASDAGCAAEAPGAQSASVRFSVSDTGIGIAPDRLGRIFEPFYRALADSERASLPGQGLGLAIVEGIVEKMGGKIEVLSDPGSGSRFEFTLALPLAPPSAEFPVSSARSARILLADDTRISRALARRVLASKGHEVVEAEDGRQAVEAVLGSDFDIVFLDLGMPLLDGIAAAKEIRSRYSSARPRSRLPRLVALTASIPSSGAEALLSLGFDEFIEKPAQAARLLEAARRAIEEALAAPIARAPVGMGPPAAPTPLIDYAGLLAAYGGSDDFLRNILSVFVEDGSKYVAALHGLVGEARAGKELMSSLHSLVNVMGAGRAAAALEAARASERYLLGAEGPAPASLAASGLEAALSQAELAIAEARAYLEGS
jgi:signal transduction histidine kinase/CheY-like chemotaxis protein